MLVEGTKANICKGKILEEIMVLHLSFLQFVASFMVVVVIGFYKQHATTIRKQMHSVNRIQEKLTRWKVSKLQQLVSRVASSFKPSNKR
ncbi:unnamed protein product [Linum trigynum]|uniref:Uncharacterized protein n=1 Tax=Linum trigynum TaxID=586398 RepID=A0AAV2EF18_9ROSI